MIIHKYNRLAVKLMFSQANNKYKLLWNTIVDFILSTKVDESAVQLEIDRLKVDVYKYYNNLVDAIESLAERVVALEAKQPIVEEIMKDQNDQTK